MSSGYARCPICKEWGFFTGRFAEHRCPPAWECRLETEDEDDWRKVHARDAEDAAEKYAERYDCESAEYAIVRGRTEAIVLVRKPADLEEEPSAEVERFAIEGESVPQYRAMKIEQAGKTAA